MISTLTANYGDEALSKMLEAAKQVRETKAMAKDLQNAQFNNWLAQDFTPTQVLNLLGMKHQLREPNAIVWYAYKAFYERAILPRSRPSRILAISPIFYSKRESLLQTT
ncbi:hypothetical protein PR003_g27723 [Phytophthora rubi]|uniref:RxLR effector protein n=1 Tax=Phytophthora rubi TaxID=129364 RepID=A0A6A3I0V7_9STRA|nr:hypothetical protein PR001_g26877 [Phytophthora rubi]KAE8974645.1 hypothetical protein PR002_g25848 [Phytophthora rubi]KAE9281273.1 hypothetical protein PR003_g27723 [Phytophthora rubi]